MVSKLIHNYPRFDINYYSICKYFINSYVSYVQNKYILIWFNYQQFLISNWLLKEKYGNLSKILFVGVS